MSTLSPREQQLYQVGLGVLPAWYSADDDDPHSTVAGFAKIFGKAWDQIDAWVDIVYLKKAFGIWLDAHARDRGTRRQASEGDDALKARLVVPADALTLPALRGIADAILAGAGVAGTAEFLEGRNGAGAYYQADGSALQSFWGDGHRWDGHPHDLYVILPAATDDGTFNSIAEAMRLFAAGGVDVYVQRAAAGTVQLVTVTPPGASLAVSTGTQQFAAQVRHADTLTWRVNGIAGGNSTVGTVDSTGLYAAPAAVPFPEDVDIQAVSVLDSSVVGHARVKLHT